MGNINSGILFQENEQVVVAPSSKTGLQSTSVRNFPVWIQC